MAITPRTIFTSAAPATVAVVSLYFFTVLGTTAFTCLTSDDEPTEPVAFDDVSADSPAEFSAACDHVAHRFGADSAEWSEFAWINYTYCFDQRDDSAMTVKAAAQGLEYHPESESLYNFKGYHQIVMGEHAEAIETLRRGMEQVTHHRNGVMANNLAWAGLWEPRMMQLDEARHLYVQSLAKSPEICETVHTGLFVEFALANQAQGLDRFEALKRFSDLRNRYNSCLDRLEDGEWKTIVEVVGAAVIFGDVDNHDPDSVHPLMRSATTTLLQEYDDFSIDDICREAIPLADFHHDCVNAVTDSLEAQKELSDRHDARNQRAAEIQDEIIEQYGHNYPVLKANDGNSLSGCGGAEIEW